MNHLKWLVIAGGILITLAFCTMQGNNNVSTSKLSVQRSGIHVLELFTSEGCSSCPPADKLMVQLVKENNPGVFVLTYHVDYWNKLGWKDSFSNEAFTARQNKYARKFNSDQIYTPQLVVNGTHEFVGSDEERLRKIIEKNETIYDTASFTAEIMNFDKNKIIFKYQLSEPKGQLINFALVQSQGKTRINRGENRGRELQHANIVRSLRTLETTSENHHAEIEFDVEPVPGKYFVLAFLQNKSDLSITNAVQINL